ncbi:cilia- and flagella-associated protein HOATZ isoform X1 [Podarcis raffonei]|uniref:cilia- and flagella-associated protein HOATZ isoform X1 n=1 Tax=Podarcis raffonei TaxID=65483 RepID=UPI0023292668|nr:cilia- and flagella-associated protein HOATZ isoform X1 [Podarcis raffonei]
METPRPETPRPEAPPTTADAAAMASPTPLPSPAFLAFTGSCEQDVTLAKSFWNSVTLQPPLESRLGPRRDSASCSSSRKGSRSEASSGTSLQIPRTPDNKKEDDKSTDNSVAGEIDLKEQHIKKSKKREEIIALLKKQREERIAKEMVSDPHKPKTRPRESEIKKKVPDSDLEDKESVSALP